MDNKQALEKMNADDTTDEELRELAEQLLAGDPSNPYGKYALWQTMDYDESVENLDLLQDALDAIRAAVQAKTTPPVIEDDPDAQLYCEILTQLGYVQLGEDKTEDALATAQELANFDDEGYYPARILLYRCMLDLGMYNEILGTLEKDPLESVAGEHARAIAMMETDADQGEIRDAVNNAIAAAPDVPFLILGIWDMPEEEEIEEEMEETVDYAAALMVPWCADDKRLAYLSAPTFLFGYLTGRLDDEKEIRALEKGYEEAEVLADVREARKRIEEMEKESKDPDEVDSNALGLAAQIVEKMMG